MKAVTAIVSGRVQGVWFRAWTKEQAGELGLSGWVRNRRDGSVEALLCGDTASVDRMLVLLKEGPPLANVFAVDCQVWAGDIPDDFTQIATL